MRAFVTSATTSGYLLVPAESTDLQSVTFNHTYNTPIIKPTRRAVTRKTRAKFGKANCGIFWLDTVCCMLCESYTRLHLREKSYNSKMN